LEFNMNKNVLAPAAVLLSLVVSGCVVSQTLPTPAADHPANPDAPEVAPAPASNTLAIQSTTEPESRPATAPMEGEHHHGH
jgi:hypothetical protein